MIGSCKKTAFEKKNSKVAGKAGRNLLLSKDPDVFYNNNNNNDFLYSQIKLYKRLKQFIKNYKRKIF